jgi:CoA:oxalate CoA-transferase
MTDGDAIITVGGTARWVGLCRAFGAQALLEDPRYATAEGRQNHVDTLRWDFAARFAKLSCAEGVALMAKHEVPAARVRTLPEALDVSHFRDWGTLRPMYRRGADVPIENGIVAGFPVVFSQGALPKLQGGAELGHHTDAVLQTLLGLDESEIAELRRRGVI